MQSHPSIFRTTICISIGLISFSFNPQYTFRSVPHKYTPYQTDNFKVEIEIRSGNKVIAGGSYISEAASSADSEYQEAYINLDYQGNMEKATDIYVNILSTTKTSFGSDDLQKAGTIDLTDCATGWTTHLGSRLKIDDLELIYE